ncbi:hypothetical protein NCAS_0C01230 [Naumovozyma castellii]|uniref:N-acetyltransferase domain-containing protein n=1 Tax=Naumovozyma castellii TaxID=27288 RepID=G0VCA4_NAUCA|nr:hypothetical protein NCAS_0C01230 [Naumovozyma castellii CBS 4309]CCC69113.1 hypothetical protein NCAS_0C01230 [Naumovozyma castellii CBS 4309]
MFSKHPEETLDVYKLFRQEEVNPQMNDDEPTRKKIWARLTKVDINNVKLLQDITNENLPISYPLSFFQEALPGNNNDVYLTRICVVDDAVAGAVKAKLLLGVNGTVLPRGIYIETLVVAKEWRSHRLGKLLLKFIEDECQNYFLHNIIVHVSTNNKRAIKWYFSNGFRQVGAELTHYYKIDNQPGNAVIMVKNIQ